jgi:AcrR family transcriptional regulator
MDVVCCAKARHVQWGVLLNALKVTMHNEAGRSPMDHRVRSAKNKRDRTRSMILEATLAACIEKGASITAEDIMREAKVSRGTFYAHFGSTNDAIAAIGRDLADSEVKLLDRYLAEVEDPIRRLAVGSLVLLSHAAIDPGWGFIIGEGADYDAKGIAVHWVDRQIEDALRIIGCERPAVSAEVLLDLCNGLVVIAARKLTRASDVRSDYIREAGTVVLEAMGVDRPLAIDAMAWAERDLELRANEHFDWWHPLAK